jgi:dTDP-3-amino-3,4,6-trideoxy-alpha-D-glucose transaminase
MIPLVDVKAQYAPLIPQLKERIADVIESGRFILGPNVSAFEEEAAAYLGVPATIGVANGTDALVLVLDAMGIGPGDEVICPSFTFYATPESIVRRGATPVFADIDPATLNLDSADVMSRVTPRTKAILAVHLYGRPVSIDDVPDGIPVLEDSAQAFGATLGAKRAGSLGAAGTFSFYPTKNLFGLGDGGLLVTQDAELAERVRLLRFHGSKDKERFDAIGYNSRLDELQAAVLRVFLPHVPAWNEGRRAAAARYDELGLGELCELPGDEPGHVYHVYCVRTRERDRIAAALRSREIGFATYYSTPLHLQPALRSLASTGLPETERAARETLALPLWPAITAQQQEEVVDCIRSALTLRAAS